MSYLISDEQWAEYQALKAAANPPPPPPVIEEPTPSMQVPEAEHEIAEPEA